MQTTDMFTPGWLLDRRKGIYHTVDTHNIHLHKESVVNPKGGPNAVRRGKYVNEAARHDRFKSAAIHDKYLFEIMNTHQHKTVPDQRLL